MASLSVLSGLLSKETTVLTLNTLDINAYVNRNLVQSTFSPANEVGIVYQFWKAYGKGPADELTIHRGIGPRNAKSHVIVMHARKTGQKKILPVLS